MAARDRSTQWMFRAYAVLAAASLVASSACLLGAPPVLAGATWDDFPPDSECYDWGVGDGPIEFSPTIMIARNSLFYTTQATATSVFLYSQGCEDAFGVHWMGDSDPSEIEHYEIILYDGATYITSARVLNAAIQLYEAPMQVWPRYFTSSNLLSTGMPSQISVCGPVLHHVSRVVRNPGNYPSPRIEEYAAFNLDARDQTLSVESNDINPSLIGNEFSIRHLEEIDGINYYMAHRRESPYARSYCFLRQQMGFAPMETLITSVGRDEEVTADLATDGDGTWILIFGQSDNAWSPNSIEGAEPGQVTTLRYRLFLSRDDGATWFEKEIALPEEFAGFVHEFSVAIQTDGKGNWVALWSLRRARYTHGENPLALGGVFVASSNDNGDTWTRQFGCPTLGVNDFGVGRSVHVDTDHRGNWIAAWETGFPTLLRYMHSSDDGRSWSGPFQETFIRVDMQGRPLDASLEFPDLAVDNHGRWRFFGQYGARQTEDGLPDGWRVGYTEFTLPPTDVTRPRVVSMEPVSGLTAEQGDAVEFEFVTDEYVLGLDSPDDVVVMGVGVTHGAVSLAGGPKRFRVRVEEVRGDGTVHLVVGLSGEGKDHAGNALEIYSGPHVIVTGPLEEPQVDWLQRLLAAFAGYDRDGNGLLDAEEIAAATNTLPEAALSSADLNGDGALGVAELAAVAGRNPYHDADTNANARMELAEVLRVIQLHRAQGYHCVKAEAMTEDGFAPGRKSDGAPPGDCAPHSADYDPKDERIDFGELLRVIQFYNSTGVLRCGQGEDGFCAVDG